jgi:hypothetical protein
VSRSRSWVGRFAGVGGERSAPTSLLLLRELGSEPVSAVFHALAARAAAPPIRRCPCRQARLRPSVRTLSRRQAHSGDGDSWQHPWQQPDRPMRPDRPQIGTIRTIWRERDGYDSRVTRLRAWSGITGWRFESSSAHRKALNSEHFRFVRPMPATPWALGNVRRDTATPGSIRHHLPIHRGAALVEEQQHRAALISSFEASVNRAPPEMLACRGARQQPAEQLRRRTAFYRPVGRCAAARV